MLLTRTFTIYLSLFISLSIAPAGEVYAQEQMLLLQEKSSNKVIGIKNKTTVVICFNDASKEDVKGDLLIIDKKHIKIESDTIALSDIKQINVPNVEANSGGKKGLRVAGAFLIVGAAALVLALTLDDLGSAILAVVSPIIAVPIALVSLPFRLAKKKYRMSAYDVTVVTL